MVYVFGDCELDTRLCELRRSGKPRPLEPQVFDVLAYLVRHRDRLVTKQELLEQVWTDRFVTEATLSSRLMAARKAIGDSGRAQRLIRTLHGRGFRFTGVVEERAGGPALPAETTVLAEVSAPAAMDFSSRTGVALAPPGLDLGRPVGRETELRRLESYWEQARNGTRQVVLIRGEAGLGKTTLVDAFLRMACTAQKPTRVAHGQCLEHRGEGEAYMPLLEAVGRMCREPGGNGLIALLAKQAPTWVLQMPWLVPEEKLAALQGRVLGSTKESMLREMVEALETVSADQPLILVLEDLHWSDYSTLDLLCLLARRREPARLLLLGTYREMDVKGNQHPLPDIARQLHLRKQCEEICLELLTPQAVEEYLAGRFPDASLPGELAPVVHQRTQGHPLFMCNVVDYWVAQGFLSEEDGKWKRCVSLDELAVGVPDSLRRMVEQQLERLSPDEQSLLEAASVAGMEFAAPAVAAALQSAEEETEARCEVLARSGRFLKRCGTAEWADSAVASLYRFAHDLYPEVLYDRVPAGRRSRLHHRIGTRLEIAYGLQAEDQATELALHFVRGRDARRAIRYLLASAQQALQRSAHREAVVHLSKGLELVGTLPDAGERTQLELGLQAKLGPALLATKGWGDPEVKRTFERARELCDTVGDTAQLPTVLCGLAALCEYRGEYPEAQTLMEQRLQQPGAPLLLESRELLACSTFHQGKFSEALEHAEQAIFLYDPQQHSLLTAAFGEDPGVACHDWAALALWFLGYPDKALEKAQQALHLTQDHYYSLASAQAQAAMIHQCRREPEQAREWAEASIALAYQQGFPYRVAVGRILRGWALVAQRNDCDGLEELRRGLAEHQDTGAKMDRPYYLALLAEAYGTAQFPEKGLEALSETLDTVRGIRTFFYEAELHRLKGALLLQANPRSAEQAETSFREALQVSQNQQAKSLELRAALSLACLRKRQQNRTEVQRLLAKVYGWFKEGLDTADLIEAKQCLSDS